MRALLTAAVCLGIAGVGALLSFLAWSTRPDRAAEAAAPDAAPPRAVRVAVVAPAPFEDLLWLTGRLDPWEERTISAETQGPIEWLGIDEGQAVKRGAEAVRIDTTALRSFHAQATARMDFAQDELTRTTDLKAAGVISPQDLDRASTERKLAAADLSASNTRLARSAIFVPIDGVIDELFHEEKEFVDVGTALFRVVQTDRLKATVGIPERDIARFAEGGAVTMIVDALDGAQVSGTIHRIAATADLATRTFQTEVAIENAEGRLKPGMTVRARLVRAVISDAITVPIFAIIAMENQYFVAVERDGVAEFRNIEAGRVEGGRVHVTKGLAAGDRLIVEGQRDLRPGQPVQPEPGAAG